jgi:hypothetical protein
MRIKAAAGSEVARASLRTGRGPDRLGADNFMLRWDPERIALLEHQYPGIEEQILRFEAAQLPVPCGSCDRDSHSGTIGRTISIAAAGSASSGDALIAF